MMDQEIYWAQRVGQTWFQLRENSKKYFQTVTTTKRMTNYIWMIKDEIVSGIGNTDIM